MGIYFSSHQLTNVSECVIIDTLPISLITSVTYAHPNVLTVMHMINVLHAIQGLISLSKILPAI